MFEELECFRKLYDYVVGIYKDLERGHVYVYDLYNSHNDLQRRIGNVLITLGNKIGMDRESIKYKENIKELDWREEFE